MSRFFFVSAQLRCEWHPALGRPRLSGRTCTDAVLRFTPSSAASASLVGVANSTLVQREALLQPSPHRRARRRSHSQKGRCGPLDARGL
eukprot:12318037-Heterocapsa_arctica.AAC.1